MTHTTRNIALTVNGSTIVRPAAHLPGCQKAARAARDAGHAVSLKRTDAPLSDVTAGLKSTGCVDDCEACGTFTGRRYWVDGAWRCAQCVGIVAVRQLAQAS